MNVQNTSKQAYKEEVEPSLGHRQQEVLIALKMAKRPINNQELADYLHKPINTITPRTHELVELGKVEEAFRAVYPKTNRRVIYWKTI